MITLFSSNENSIELSYSDFLVKVRRKQLSEDYLLQDEFLTSGEKRFLSTFCIYQKYNTENFKKIKPDNNCKCYNPNAPCNQFNSNSFGVDKFNGRYGEIEILQCVTCSENWIRYFVEYESQSRSGRWYRGLISNEEIQKLKPEAVIVFLENQHWFFYGGSYFDTDGKLGYFDISVDG